MTTTSMLTTCRCVLTLSKKRLSASVIASVSANINCSFFSLNVEPISAIHVIHDHVLKQLRIAWRTELGGCLCCVAALTAAFFFFYRQGYNSRKEFIAAQGPLPTTVNEFWRMIWEKNVQTLVMLTRCNEQGRVSNNTHTHTHRHNA